MWGAFHQAMRGALQILLILTCYITEVKLGVEPQKEP